MYLLKIKTATENPDKFQCLKSPVVSELKYVILKLI